MLVSHWSDSLLTCLKCIGLCVCFTVRCLSANQAVYMIAKLRQFPSPKRPFSELPMILYNILISNNI